MQARSLVVLVLVVSASAAAPAAAPDGAASQAAAAKVKEDFSTPRAAVETFFAAAAARDADLLSRCFGDTGPSEFDQIRKKQVPSDGLDHMAKLFGVGKVLKVEQGSNDAFVDVKLSTRDERITMKRVGNKWVIDDF